MSGEPQHRSAWHSVDGVLLLDKAGGMSSNLALQKARRLFQARKAGHTGSLDPLASGLLPLCFGEATKLCGYLLRSDKCYQVRVRLGVVTETGDSEGQVLETRPVPTLESGSLESLLDRFRGEILQVPPMYSALKHQGRRLYDLARCGIQIEREARKVTIHELRLLTFGQDWMELEVHCSKGTYIRTLAEDLGRELGCGGHVETLRRTAVGGFRVIEAHTLETLSALSDEARLASLLLPDSIVQDYPSIVLNDAMAFHLRRGQPILAPKAPTEGWVRLYVGPEKYLGMGEMLEDGRVAPRRLLHSQTN